jgi:hypothetical protein
MSFGESLLFLNMFDASNGQFENQAQMERYFVNSVSDECGFS